MENLSLYIESLIFTARKSISVKEISETLNAYFDVEISNADIQESLLLLSQKYKEDRYPFEIIEIADGYQFMTKGLFYPIVGQFLRLESNKKISRAALETLAIVSYKQPVTKSTIESIRGVNCDYSIQKLLDKELVEITGRDEGPGRPLIYGTTEKFMNHFGLKNLNELPKLKEFESEENQVGLKDEEE
jgi:segregation and condensation protein B